MIRTILISTALLAAAGAAQAAEMKVSLVGKSESAVRAEIAEAAKAVCQDVSVMEYAPCVVETYQNAMNHVEKAKAAKLATVAFR